MRFLKWLLRLKAQTGCSAGLHCWRYVQPPSALRPFSGIVECERCGKVDMEITP